MTHQTILNLLQLAVCLGIGYSALCRLDRLQLGRSDHGAIAGQIALLLAACVGGLGFALPAPLNDPATIPSVAFCGCVLVSMLAGTDRWRHHGGNGIAAIGN